MLRHSTAPLAICVFLLAGCGSGSDAPSVVAEPEQVTPPSESEDTIELVVTSPPTGESRSSTAKSGSPSLAELPENQPWTLLARASNGRGGYIGLRIQDNGNGDADAFTYDEDTGELTLVDALDFERPSDADGDSVFELEAVAYEYPGLPAFPFSLDVVDQKEIFEDYPVVWLTGETVFGGLGRNFTPLGDMDDDGRPDLAVAAPGRHSIDAYSALPPAGYHPAGELYVVSGEALSKTTYLELDETSGPGIWHIRGTDDDLNVGYNMTEIGDLNGDGVAEFVVASDAHSIDVISGASMVKKMTLGEESAFGQFESGTLRLDGDRFDHELSPRTFAAIGDLDEDGLSELAFCATQYRYSSVVDAHIFVVAGAVLKDALAADADTEISDILNANQAGYIVYTGNHRNCGPLTALGDIDADQLTDVAIPMPGPLADDSGLLVYSGAELQNTLQLGGRRAVSAFQRVIQGKKDPYTHFTDRSAKATEQHYMATALGDVTGDDIDDFAFSWGRYHTANDSAYIVKGQQDLLANNGSTKNLRSLFQNGGAIQLAASPNGLAANEYRVEPIHALPAPADGLHETLIFVGAGETSATLFESLALSADDLPDGGTAIVDLPIAAYGSLDIPRGYSRRLSYISSVGDLNQDGYSDLAVGWDLVDSGSKEDSGAVLLVSGAYMVEAFERGETLQPTKMYQRPAD